MDKEKLLAALYALQNGEGNSGAMHDELETLIGIVVDLDDSVIEAAWKELREDTEAEPITE